MFRGLIRVYTSSYYFIIHKFVTFSSIFQIFTFVFISECISDNLTVRYLFELGVDGKIILKFILNTVCEGIGVGPSQDKVNTSFCEHGDEHSSFIVGEELVDR